MLLILFLICPLLWRTTFYKNATLLLKYWMNKVNREDSLSENEDDVVQTSMRVGHKKALRKVKLRKNDFSGFVFV